MKNERRDFIKKSLIGSAGIAISGIGFNPNLYASITESYDHINLISALNSKEPLMKFGLVTYQWGKDWELPTLISNCETTGFQAIELRTQHAHKVETVLSASQRSEVKKRFAGSPVTCVGYGSNFEYHNPDKAVLRENIEQTKEYIKLCKDIGATGIKVKPNNLPSEIPYEKTIAQIAASLNEVGNFAGDQGLLVRVEAHGPRTQELSVMKAIFEQVTDPNVKICWNSNSVDLNPPGIEANFNMVKQWIGDTVHVRELNLNDYPYQQLFNFLAGIKFKGWILLEASSTPVDKIAAMKEQLIIFNELMGRISKE